MSNLLWQQRDLTTLWHPCTQMKDHEWLPLIPIEKGKGVWLYDFAGRRYLDAISSWWVNLFGHSNPTINQAITAQLDKLEHVILAGFTHPPAIELAEKLVKLTPQGLNRVFYTDNGSSAIEAAIKMSFHYWQNRGDTKRHRFITLSNSYHGETLGALAVGDVALYKNTYAPLLMEVITAPSPDCFMREVGESWESCSLRAIAALATILEQNAATTCAILIEPLVQCAGGMRMYHPTYLTRLRQLCDRYQIHLIADEIAVGFGRTGTLFACEQGAITPDFLCLSKGLTGGYLPLAALLTSEAIYQAFYDDYANNRAFLHSHSFTGNPLACSAALATISLFENTPVLESNRKLAAYIWEKTAHLNDHPHIAEVRQTGMILAVEMVKNKAQRTPYPWQERRGLQIYQYALQHEALLRPLGNVVYLMPPYIITEAQIDTLAQLITDAIHLVTKN